MQISFFLNSTTHNSEKPVKAKDLLFRAQFSSSPGSSELLLEFIGDIIQKTLEFEFNYGLPFDGSKFP